MPKDSKELCDSMPLANAKKPSAPKSEFESSPSSCSDGIFDTTKFAKASPPNAPWRPALPTWSARRRAGERSPAVRRSSPSAFKAGLPDKLSVSRAGQASITFLTVSAPTQPSRPQATKSNEVSSCFGGSFVTKASTPTAPNAEFPQRLSSPRRGALCISAATAAPPAEPESPTRPSSIARRFGCSGRPATSASRPSAPKLLLSDKLNSSMVGTSCNMVATAQPPMLPMRPQASRAMTFREAPR
mmetsp:Transcript_72821/g.236585  ORF Transcript_72821/g.236585 Transcript_72821/m.236585 type:complete len:244 (-) Transcript_72821:687-1418(-)